MHHAAKNGNENIVQELIQNGADVNIENKSGKFLPLSSSYNRKIYILPSKLWLLIKSILVYINYFLSKKEDFQKFNLYKKWDLFFYSSIKKKEIFNN